MIIGSRRLDSTRYRKRITRIHGRRINSTINHSNTIHVVSLDRLCFLFCWLMVHSILSSSSSSSSLSFILGGAVSRSVFVRAMSTAATASSSPTPSSMPGSKGALIFLHGLGDTPAGWSHMQFALPQYHPNLADITYIFPLAPTIPISINGGMAMPGWFDLYDWPIGVGSEDDKDGLLKGVDRIQKDIKSLMEERGIPPEKIVVGGFSQGGAVALLGAYHQRMDRQGSEPQRLAGCAALSGWFTLVDEIEKMKLSDPVKQIPLFWGHGQYDDKVLFQQQKFGVDKLTEFGVKNINSQSYEMGHSSHPDEMQAFADFVHECIFGGGDVGAEEGTTSTGGDTKSDL